MDFQYSFQWDILSHLIWPRRKHCRYYLKLQKSVYKNLFFTFRFKIWYFNSKYICLHWVFHKLTEKECIKLNTKNSLCNLGTILSTRFSNEILNLNYQYLPVTARWKGHWYFLIYNYTSMRTLMIAFFYYTPHMYTQTFCPSSRPWLHWKIS